MKEKKGNWFTRNSNWLFIVLLLASIVLMNVIFSYMKTVFRYGLDLYTQWPFLLLLIFLFILLLLMFLFLYFIIYLEDALQGRNKRKFRIFDALIDKVIQKGEKIEKK